MSSSSSGGDRPAERLLCAALDALEREAPAHHDLLCAALIALPVDLHVGRELIALRIVADRLRVARPDGSARVAIHTDLSTAYALLDAQLTMLEAVRRGVLDVRGHAAALCAASEALSTFLHGLVRCPSGAALLRDLHVHACREKVSHAEPIV